MKIKRDGVQLFFNTAGQGSAFVFIHGTGGDHTHFSPQFKHFAQIGKVLVPDLRGHGKSDKPKQEYTIEGFADDVAWLCKMQKIKSAIIVGQSMGGNIALELAASFPKLSTAIILLDSGILYPHSVSMIFNRYLKGLQSRNYQPCIRQIVKASCLPTDKCQPQIEKTFLATPQYVWCSAFENMFKWNKNRLIERIKRCKIPILYIQATNPLVNLTHFAKLCPQLMTAKVVGSGHFLALEVPQQINPMIERFIKIGVTSVKLKK